MPMIHPKAFCLNQIIRFFHCDPAGIVYYPNYFDMIQSLMEDWFTQSLRIDYADYISNRRLGLPTVKIECEFMAPSKIGETITLVPHVTKIGRSSLALRIDALAGEQLRLRAHIVVVTTSLENNRAIPIPPDLREKLVDYQQQTQEEA